MSDSSKKGVLLLNMGGPETLDDVRPFLFRLFRDPDIIPLPRWLRWLSWPIAWLIAKFRAPKSKLAYAAIGGGSPQRRTNQDVLDKLLQKINTDTEPVTGALAMRYWHPLTDEALDKLEAENVEKLVCIPMYPQYSTTTTGSSYGELTRRLAVRKDRWDPDVSHIMDYHQDERYLAAVIRRLMPLIEKFAFPVSQCCVLFSAHSIPVDRIRDDDDPYAVQIEAMVEHLSRSVPEGIRCDLAYQSRVGPVEWLGPSVPDVIELLAREGIRAIVVVPVSFVSEHVETLEELDQEYAALAAEQGIQQFLRVPTVQADDDFVTFLAELYTETST